MRKRSALVASIVIAAAAACASNKRELGSAGDATAEEIDGGTGDADADADAATGIDISTKPKPDAACGYEAITAKQDPANLYLVIDRSGSMAEMPPNGASTKYEAVGKAVVSLARKIGWRSKLSLTLFPGSQGNSCSPGIELLPLQPGDAKSFVDQGKSGPVALALQKMFLSPPGGGTPTGATLAKLAQSVDVFAKNSYVLLATDGAPNCNDLAKCDASHCIVNIEGACSGPQNCCDPSLGPMYSPANCIDRDATLAAVLKLAAAGVKTVVIGIPGSDAGPYAETLDLLAVAGGAPRPGQYRYYRVEDLSALEDLLSTIGAQIVVNCDVTLESAPSDPDAVNIYFDDTLVPNDETNGWTWSGPKSLTLHGTACDTLLAGGVGQIQMLVGCPTEKVK